MPINANLTRLLHALDGTQLVRWYPQHSLVAAWNGLLTINIISTVSGHVTDCHTLGGHTDNARLVANKMDIYVGSAPIHE